MDAISEYLTGVVTLLAIFAAAIVTPYAVKELRLDWRQIRAQFAGAFGLTLVGIAYRMGVAYYFWSLSPAERLAALDLIQWHVLVGNILLIVGMALVIRSVTLRRMGELGWVMSVTAAIIIVAMPWRALISTTSE